MLRIEVAPDPQIIRSSELGSGSVVAELLPQDQESWIPRCFLTEMTMILQGHNMVFCLFNVCVCIILCMLFYTAFQKVWAT